MNLIVVWLETLFVKSNEIISYLVLVIRQFNTHNKPPLPVTMPAKNKYTAVAAGLLIASSALLQNQLPEYPVIAFGFFFGILLTFFNTNFSTIIAGICSTAFLIAVAIAHQQKYGSGVMNSRHLFSIFIVATTTLLILYIKGYNRTMSRTRKYYTNVFEHATEGILLADDKANIYLINPAMQQMFGYTEAELIGQPIDILIPNRYHHRHHQHQEGFYHQPSVRRMGEGRDLSAVRKDGKEFPVEVSLSYFKDGNKTFVIAFVMDITLRKQAEEKLITANTDLRQLNAQTSQLNEELEDKVMERTLMLQEALKQVESSLEKEKELSEIKSRFVSMASHEFRTPLSTVLFSASLLGKYVTTEDQDKRTRHVLKIKESVRHLNNILEDFLSLGKLNEGHIRALSNEFFVEELMDDVIEQMTGLLKPGQELILKCEKMPSLCSDARLIKNILINLLSNAIKYSPEQAAINITARFINNSLSIQIQDKGIGIPSEDIPHLFTSFFRGKNAINIKGTGLGLLIVKRYMDLLEGKISLDSTLSHGTTVEITIPNHLKTRHHEQLDPYCG